MRVVDLLTGKRTHGKKFFPTPAAWQERKIKAERWSAPGPTAASTQTAPVRYGDTAWPRPTPCAVGW
jgi:hypothetical protein